MTTKTTRVLICPVFKTNYGIHFCTEPMAGLGHGAWYEVALAYPLPAENLAKSTILRDAVNNLIMAAQIGIKVLEIKFSRQVDYVVTYEEMPKGKRAVITPHGYKIVEDTEKI